jgi:ATP-dependent DNA helicase RecQ
VQDFLEVTEDSEYPLLRITAEGRALCQDRGSVKLGQPAPAGKAKKKPKALKAVAGDFSDADEAVFHRLRALRRALADKAGIPPYVICHDSALVEMAAARPATPEALLEIKGMGEKRVQKYGAAFLAAVAGQGDLPEAD